MSPVREIEEWCCLLCPAYGYSHDPREAFTRHWTEHHGPVTTEEPQK